MIEKKKARGSLYRREDVVSLSNEFDGHRPQAIPGHALNANRGRDGPVAHLPSVAYHRAEPGGNVTTPISCTVWA